MSTAAELSPGQLILLPTGLAEPVGPQSSPQFGEELPPNMSIFLPNFDTGSLRMLLEYEKETRGLPRRLHQKLDISTVQQAIEELHPEYMPVQTLWENLGGKRKFDQPTWSEHSKYFGSHEMYSDPTHKDSVHGEMHQDKGRVLALVEILGQYKKLSPSDMKILRVAAAVHDMARENDMEDKNHGLRAARNVDGSNEDDPTKNYLATYKQRGIEFSPEEVTLLKILCVYHEKPWELVPLQYQQDKRVATLIQTLQAADGLDRFRAGHPRWYPQQQFFMRFFDNDTGKIDAAFAFAKYLTLESERYRLEESAPAEQAMQYILRHVGFLRNETIDTTQPFGTSTLRRMVPYGNHY